MSNHYNKNTKSSAGFTAVELCVVIVIFGFMAMFLTDVWSKYEEKRKLDVTLSESLDVSSDTLVEFAGAMQYYPCPADPGLSPADANYGLEARNAVTDLCEAAGDIVQVAGLGGEPVMIGALPFRTLLNEGFGGVFSGYMHMDGWGNKLTYAVTRDLADPNTDLNEYNGAIYLADNATVAAADVAAFPDGYSLVEPEGTLHAILVSHGPNGVGAYMESGDEIDGCAVSSAGPPGFTNPPDEGENCDRNDANFVMGAKSEVAGQFFDDYVQPIRFVSNVLWAVNADDDLIAQTPGNVGVGVNDPQDKLHVAGSVRGGDLESDRLCDDLGTLCMDTDLLSANKFPVFDEGGNPDTDCPSGEVMFMIRGNTGYCQRPSFVIPAGFSCPPGEAITQVYSDGTNPDCAVVAP